MQFPDLKTGSVQATVKSRKRTKTRSPALHESPSLNNFPFPVTVYKQTSEVLVPKTFTTFPRAARF